MLDYRDPHFLMSCLDLFKNFGFGTLLKSINTINNLLQYLLDLNEPCFVRVEPIPDADELEIR